MTDSTAMIPGGPAGRQGWTVTGQSEATGADATGNYVRGLQVTFRTDAGLQGSVFVPLAGFGVESVRRAIAERVQLMTAVQNLTG